METYSAHSETNAGTAYFKIYSTTYKKGGIVNVLHFEHPGDLNSAVESVKNWLNKHHMKHIHTVPFLINLDEDHESAAG